MDWGAMYGLLTGYQPAAVLMAAGSTGILAVLARSVGNVEEVAAETGTSVRGAEALLRGLVAIGVATVDGSRYSLTDDARALDRDGAEGLRRLVAKESVFYGLWGRLADAVRSGDALLMPFEERAATDPAAAGAFLLALNDLAERVAPGFAAAAALDDVRRLADVGGGGGACADLLARAYPSLDVTIVELPDVVPITQRALEERGADRGRVRVVAGDARRPGLGIDEAPFDAVLVSHVLHDLDTETARTVVGSAAGMVRDGGPLLVHDVFRRDGAVDPGVALFDVMMLVENPGGRTHGLTDVIGWMAEKGFADVAVHDFGFSSLLRARR